MTDDLTQTMVDVRKASRLLAGYYRRLVTILEMADGALVVEGFTFDRWRPMNCDPVGKGTRSPVGRWGWDFLPWYDAEFVWTHKDGRRVVLHHQTDTGYQTDEGRQPDPVHFVRAEEASSRVEVRTERDAEHGAVTWDMHRLVTREDVEAFVEETRARALNVR